jgi:hypothetical protein
MWSTPDAFGVGSVVVEDGAVAAADDLAHVGSPSIAVAAANPAPRASNSRRVNGMAAFVPVRIQEKRRAEAVC